MHLLRVMHRFPDLPDALLTVNVGDGMFENKHQVFVADRYVRKDGRPNGVMSPDFTFYSWPESECPRDTSHSWTSVFDIFREEVGVATWDEKQDLLHWRGSKVSNPYRGKVIEWVRQQNLTEFVDMRFSFIHSDQDKGKVDKCERLTEACQYRFLVHLPGNTYSSRLKYLLLCGSVVFAPPMEWEEWWHHRLVPGVHYVAVAHDWHDLGSKLRPLLADKVSARRIADAGRALALEMFDSKSVDCYWRLLIEEAHRFLPQASVESEDEIPLADVLVTDSRKHFSVPFQVSPPLSRGDQ